MKGPQLRILFPLLVCLTFLGCGAAAWNGNNETHLAAVGSVRVSISPNSSSLQLGQTVQFSASVSGTRNTGIRWLVNGTIGGNSKTGTISSSGMYKAPAAAPSGAITVTARSVAQPTASANAEVSISSSSPSSPPPSTGVSVTLTPASITLQAGASQQFSATISGTSNTAVKWLVNDTVGGNSAIGTITSSGLYTAPKSVPSGSITATAQSAAQSSASDSSAVSVVPATISVSISPANASVEVGKSEQFTATVSGTSSTAVNWLVSGILGGNASVGQITSNGLYTAPATVPSTSVVVTARISAYSGNSASASVTITQGGSHEVVLSWNAAASVAGYNVYRAAQASGPFTKINSNLETATVYTDSAVTSGHTYYYATTAVSSSGRESGHSNLAQATIP